MSKMAASLLCDFVVPVVGGSIFEALSTMATLCGEMKENEVVCRRVYDRLRFVCEELQRCSDASSLHESRVLALYGCAISQFLEFLEKNSQKRLLRRLIESSRVAERIQEFHEEIDQLFKLLSIVHMAEMSVWRKEWEQDRTLQRNMLRDALAEARCVHNAGSPSNSLATLSTSTCSSDGSNSSEDQTLDVHVQGQKLLHGNDFLDTEQRLVVREKELEEAIRDHIAENGYDVCSVLNLLRSVPSASLALRGAVVLHELEVELQPEVLCLALPSFIQEFTHSLGGKSDPRSVYARQMAERYWVEWFPSYIRALVQGHGLVVENAANSDILYAPGNEFKLDTTWRHIVTWTGDGIKWKPSEDELEAQWRLVPENDTKTLFRIVNFRYPYEWMYATSVACQEGNGITLALSSQPPRGRDESRAERAPEALWELQPVTGLGGGDSGSFSLFNPHTGGYLCTNEYNLDSQRRLVHILPQNAVSLSEAPTMRRCTWRLRTCTDQDADHHMKCLTGDGQDGCASPPHVPEAAREFAALELVVRDLFESSGHDVGAVVAFIRKLPETKHILFACSIARALDVEASKNCTSRRDGLVLPFFIYELATNLPVNTRKLAEQYWCHWFSPVVKSMVVGHGVLLKTNGSGVPEYLVSPEGKLSSDDKLRPVVSKFCGENKTRFHIGGRRRSRDDWVLGTDILEAQWQFVPVDASCTRFRITNYRYPYEEMLALSQHCSSSCYVVTSRPRPDSSTLRSPAPRHEINKCCKCDSPKCANEDPQDLMSLWELHEVGPDSYELFHPQRQAVLCTTSEKLDKHRLTLLRTPEKSREGLKTRGWHFRLPLGLD